VRQCEVTKKAFTWLGVLRRRQMIGTSVTQGQSTADQDVSRLTNVIDGTETARGATSLANTWQNSAVSRPVIPELPAGTMNHTAHRITRLILQHGHLDATRTVFWGGFERVVAQQLMW
jgi:hypothetical protein